VDPDIITGYNIVNFDIPYLLNRANRLKIKNFPYLGRIKDSQSKIKESMIQSKQMGRRENKDINTEGRVQFDLLQVRILVNEDIEKHGGKNSAGMTFQLKSLDKNLAPTDQLHFSSVLFRFVPNRTIVMYR
jgi:hypothetical protein